VQAEAIIFMEHLVPRSALELHCPLRDCAVFPIEAR
jgi:hypothetical protein